MLGWIRCRTISRSLSVLVGIGGHSSLHACCRERSNFVDSYVFYLPLPSLTPPHLFLAIQTRILTLALPELPHVLQRHHLLPSRLPLPNPNLPQHSAHKLPLHPRGIPLHRSHRATPHSPPLASCHDTRAGDVRCCIQLSALARGSAWDKRYRRGGEGWCCKRRGESLAGCDTCGDGDVCRRLCGGHGQCAVAAIRVRTPQSNPFHTIFYIFNPYPYITPTNRPHPDSFPSLSARSAPPLRPPQIGPLIP